MMRLDTPKRPRFSELLKKWVALPDWAKRSLELDVEIPKNQHLSLAPEVLEPRMMLNATSGETPLLFDLPEVIS